MSFIKTTSENANDSVNIFYQEYGKGKPVIFIPSPNVAEDHQTKNAQAIVDKKGALMLKESELDAQFGLVFEVLLKDQRKQNQLSENIKLLAMPEATKQIVDEIVKLIK